MENEKKSLIAWSKTPFVGVGSHDDIRTGSLQRIANACELMVADREATLRDLKYYKDRVKHLNDVVNSKDREINSNRSLISRYRNKAKKLEEELTELKKLFNAQT